MAMLNSQMVFSIVCCVCVLYWGMSGDLEVPAPLHSCDIVTMAVGCPQQNCDYTWNSWPRALWPISQHRKNQRNPNEPLRPLRSRRPQWAIIGIGFGRPCGDIAPLRVRISNKKLSNMKFTLSISGSINLDCPMFGAVILHRLQGFPLGHMGCNRLQFRSIQFHRWRTISNTGNVKAWGALIFPLSFWEQLRRKEFERPEGSRGTNECTDLWPAQRWIHWANMLH